MVSRLLWAPTWGAPARRHGVQLAGYSVSNRNGPRDTARPACDRRVEARQVRQAPRSQPSTPGECPLPESWIPGFRRERVGSTSRSPKLVPRRWHGRVRPRARPPDGRQRESLREPNACCMVSRLFGGPHVGGGAPARRVARCGSNRIGPRNTARPACDRGVEARQVRQAPRSQPSTPGECPLPESWIPGFRRERAGPTSRSSKLVPRRWHGRARPRPRPPDGRQRESLREPNACCMVSRLFRGPPRGGAHARASHAGRRSRRWHGMLGADAALAAATALRRPRCLTTGFTSDASDGGIALAPTQPRGGDVAIARGAAVGLCCARRWNSGVRIIRSGKIPKEFLCGQTGVEGQGCGQRRKGCETRNCRPGKLWRVSSALPVVHGPSSRSAQVCTRGPHGSRCNQRL